MKVTNKKIKKRLEDYKIPEFDKSKMIETIEASKKEYIKHQGRTPISFKEFIMMQIRFINPFVWIFQVCTLIVFSIILYDLRLGENEVKNIYLLLSFTAPIVAFTGFPEILKSISYNTYEIESSTYFSMQKLTAARIFIFAITDLFCLTFILSLVALGSSESLLQLILYLLVPFNITCCGCITVLNHVKSRNGSYYCLGIATICMLFTYIISNYDLVYKEASTVIWLVIFIISLGYLSRGIVISIKKETRNILHFNNNI